MSGRTRRVEITVRHRSPYAPAAFGKSISAGL
ncbi:hypothetical protein Ae150APs1_5921 [Pseudonocardia sp. Ae150A_Ps1]|nr:hypothetical protein Ae150APs1_5921 [Pseudonocardia sp. Ae150A_Ps1]